MDAENLLLNERADLVSYLDWRFFSDSGPGPFPKVNGNISAKNAEASKHAREEGNSLYKNCAFPFLMDYEEVWNLYSECIALAPNNSEELALGYGNRSALLFQVNAFEDCILDCDRALNVTSSDYLTVKILCRKARSLAKLKQSAEEVRDRALQLLDELEIEKKEKNNFRAMLFHELDSCGSSVSSEDDESAVCKKNKFSDCNDLLDFERSEQIPCASKSVAIQYNEKWGRHIVATEDIQPGEIIAIEKSCFNFPGKKHTYQHCGNCMKFLFLHSFIPCENCAYNVYCNESCRKEAWDKFHQFECCFMIFYHSERGMLNYLLYPLRMTLLAVHEAGGLEQVKKQLIEIENTEDVSKKGFTNGIFEDGKMKTALGLEPALEKHFSSTEYWLHLGTSSLTVYLLAKYTTFFGKKMNIIESKLFCNKDRLFTAALVLRSFNIISANLHVRKNIDDATEVTAYYLKTFGSLFNHSCDPNVAYCPTQHCKDIYYALYPIKKGSQLFVAYHFNTFLNKSKELRQQELQKRFSCECTACNENWSSICLPSLKVLLKFMPTMREEVLIDIVKSGKKQIDPTGEFGPLILKREIILLYLRLLAKHFTVYCKEYFSYLKCLNDIYKNLNV